jgi:hypothetical protein
MTMRKILLERIIMGKVKKKKSLRICDWRPPVSAPGRYKVRVLTLQFLRHSGVMIISKRILLEESGLAIRLESRLQQ